MQCKSAEELITLYVDKELDPDTAATLVNHLDICAACRQEYDLECRIKNLVRERIRPIKAPETLYARITTSLETVSGPSSWWQRTGEMLEWYPRRIAGVLAASLLVTATIALVGTSRNSPALVIELVKHHADCPIELSTGQPEALQDWFETRGVPVSIGAPSLEAFDYQLLGAHLCQMLHRDAAYMVYENEGLEISICCVKDIQIDFEVLDQVDFRNARFYTITYGDRNLVLWQEQDTVFAIIGQAARDELVAVAAGTRSL